MMKMIMMMSMMMSMMYISQDHQFIIYPNMKSYINSSITTNPIVVMTITPSSVMINIIIPIIIIYSIYSISTSIILID